VAQVESFLDPTQYVSFALPSVTPATPEVATSPGRTRASILVVDDSPVNRELLRSILEPFGYTVIAAAGVREAIALAGERQPDLIVSDLHMPDVDGYGFLKAAQSEPVLRQIPFAMISSTVWRDSDPGIALGLGADAFILRPIEPQDLVGQIEACLARRTARKLDDAKNGKSNVRVPDRSSHPEEG
jgi:two-component system cell cycle response regulator